MTQPAALVRTQESAPNPFVSAVSGTVSETREPNGLVTVRLAFRLRGGPGGAARIDLRGVPGDEGVSMTASGVSFVPATTRTVYIGKVIGLDGTRVVADVRDHAKHLLRLSFDLQIGTGSHSVTGVLSGSVQGGDSG